MYVPVYTRQFEKDLRRVRRRGKNLEKLKIVARALAIGKPLDALHRDHRLIGSFQGRRECHIESDWLLICKLSEKQIIFERTGTHADLFQR